MNFFAYGTLMFPEVWRLVVGRRFVATSALLPGFTLYSLRNEEFPAIAPTGRDGCVHGLVYLEIDDHTLMLLDRFEGDIYRRETHEVVCDDGQRLSTEVYVISPRRRSELVNEPWDRERFLADGGLERFLARHGPRTRRKD